MHFNFVPVSQTSQEKNFIVNTVIMPIKLTGDHWNSEIQKGIWHLNSLSISQMVTLEMIGEFVLWYNLLAIIYYTTVEPRFNEAAGNRIDWSIKSRVCYIEKQTKTNKLKDWSWHFFVYFNRRVLFTTSGNLTYSSQSITIKVGQQTCLNVHFTAKFNKHF